MQAALDELIEQLPQSADRLLDQIGPRPAMTLQGTRWFVHALQVTERLALEPQALNPLQDPFARCMRRLLAVTSCDGPLEQVLRPALLTISARALRVALPYAQLAAPEILRALDWSDLEPLHRLVFKIASANPRFDLALLATSVPPAGELFGLPDLPNSPVVEHGILERAMLVGAVQAADPQHLQDYLAVMRASSLSLANTLTAVDAVRDVNRNELKKAVGRHQQAAMKVLGLLPVLDEADLIDRYRMLRRAYKDASKFGSERKANTQAAALAGLENLAQAAGFPDATRLEWAVERKISERSAAQPEVVRVGEWHLEECMEEDELRLAVSKAGKRLKSVPAAVRKSAEYAQFKERQAALLEQGRRFRGTLERMMCDQDAVPLDELQHLHTLPAMRSLLDRLILRDGSGRLGLPALQNGSLVDVRGERHSIDTAVRVAHAIDLFDVGELAQWQRLIVSRRMIQPFKQAFREIYLCTPAEEEAAAHSNRFAGHSVISAVAAKLLQARGWLTSSGDCAQVYKIFPSIGLTAYFLFLDSGHFFGETPTVVTDRLQFFAAGRSVPLRKVPRILFSEVMRDADLVVCVAQADRARPLWSGEMISSRRQLVETLTLELSLSGVQCEEQFVFVQGKRARYRIHLGSGAIHIEPGQYLCIVPDPSVGQRLYLPFVDSDGKTSEIISKVLLLSQDDTIADDSIVRQIESATRASRAR